MAWEVHTFGGGDYLWDIFNGIAAITQGKGYLSIVTISALFGLTWAMLQSSFGGGYKASLTWIVSFMLFYNVMFLPKAEVLVSDPLHAGDQYKAIKGVPIALAMFASLSSQVGKNLTEQFDAAFSPPDYLSYHQHGMLFGSKLITMSTSMKIVDEDFASSVNSFMKQCVFYDLLLHRYSLDELKKSPDIWKFLTKDKLASQARSFAIVEGSNQQIVTCRSGVELLNKRWEDQINKSATIFGMQIFPDTSHEAARIVFLGSLPISYKQLKNISTKASEIIRQNLLISSMDRAAGEFSNIGKSGANLYTAVRADVQTKAAFNASRRQAESWVPILRIVFEVLFYGAFPLVFLLFMLPIGPQVAKGYFTGFVWLQSWGPLYAILNRIMTGFADSKMAAVGGDYGLSIITQSGIAAVQQDISEMAGYLVWLIPFLAAGIAKGAVAISGLSASMLAVPQSAANSAAAEAATGNISLGNMNLDNVSHSNVSANKINDSAFFDSARVQAINHTGGMTTINSDGRAVYDQTGSVSKLPNMQVSTNDSMVESASQTANNFQTMGENAAKQASFAKSKSIDQLAQAMSNHSVNENSGMRFTEHASAEDRAAYSRIEQEANELARNNNIDKSTAFGLVMSGNAGFSAGIGKGGVGLGGESSGLKISGSGGVNISNDARSGTSHLDSEKIARLNSLQKDTNTVLSAVRDRSLELSDSHGNSLNESFNQNYSEAQRLEEQSRTYFDTAKSFSDQAQLMQSKGVSFSHFQDQEIIEKAMAQKGPNGLPLEERVLSTFAHKPKEAAQIVNSIISDTQGSISNSFKHNASSVSGSDLHGQYTDAAANIKDEVGTFDNSLAKSQFDDATEGRHIANSNLKVTTQDTINARKVEIGGVQMDKAGLAKEVKEKLSHDAGATMINAGLDFVGITDAKKPKTNFNNEGGN